MAFTEQLSINGTASQIKPSMYALGAAISYYSIVILLFPALLEHVSRPGTVERGMKRVSAAY